jgi:hypothetical protein
VQLQHTGNRRGRQGAGRLSDGRPAGFAGQFPIGFHASRSGTRSTDGKIDRELVATAEVHFIWRLASEGGVEAPPPKGAETDGLLLYTTAPVPDPTGPVMPTGMPASR